MLPQHLVRREIILQPRSKHNRLTGETTQQATNPSSRSTSVLPEYGSQDGRTLREAERTRFWKRPVGEAIRYGGPAFAIPFAALTAASSLYSANKNREGTASPQQNGSVVQVKISASSSTGNVAASAANETLQDAKGLANETEDAAARNAAQSGTKEAPILH